jgi:putative transposase
VILGLEEAVAKVRFPTDLVDQLMDAVGPDIELNGPDGLLASLQKAVLERALDAELTEHLGYERGDAAGNGSGNSRNGTTPKTLHTETGSIDLEVPRDRAATFNPLIVPKGTTRLDGFNDRIISLYASGMTVRDIQGHLADMYQVEVSPDMISRVTDAVHAQVKEWQARPLDRVYPVIWIDAIVCKVREEGVVRNKSAYLVLAVDVEGRKQVLGIWVQATEGAKFWLHVLNELRNRGVEDVLVLVCDGLTGLPDVAETVWPAVWVQTCIVHLVRNSLALCSYKDRRRVAADLKAIYRADSEAAAAAALDEVEAAWAFKYPGIIRMWRDKWERVIPFLAFPVEIRKVVYTTNALESVNYQLRKVTRNRGHFPNDDALIKLLYLAIRKMERHGRRGMGGNSAYSWTQALNQFHIYFPGRLDVAQAIR